jgi:WD40 repeat protein
METLSMLRIILPLTVVCALTWTTHDVLAQGTTTPPRVDSQGDPLPAGAGARLGSTRFRHGGKQLLGYSLDGKMLRFHSPGAIHYMDVATGKFAKVARYTDAAQAAMSRYGDAQTPVLSGDGKVLTYFDGNEQAFGIVDAVAVKELKRLKADTVLDKQAQFDRVRYQLSHDGRLLVVFDNEFLPNNIKSSLAWVDTTTGQKLHAVTSQENARWRQAQLSHDGKLLVVLSVGGKDGDRLHVYDTASGKEVRTLPVDRAFEFSFALRPDGKTLIGWMSSGGVGGGQPNPVALYDMSEDKQLKEVRKFGNLGFGGGTVALTPDGKELFVRTGGTIAHWDVDNGQQIRILPAAQADDEDGFRNQGARPLIFSYDGKQLAAPNAKTVAVYAVATGNLLTPATLGGSVTQVLFMPDGQALLACTSTQGNWIWDVKQGKLLHKLAQTAKGQQPFQMFHGELALSRDGKYAAQCPGTGGTEIWDTASGKHLFTLGENKDNNIGFFGLSNPVAFAAQGYMLASAGSDGTVRLWNASTGKPLRQWIWQKMDNKIQNFSESGIMALAFSPDGKTLAGAGFTGLDERRGMSMFLILWETATGRERLRLDNPLALGRDDVGLFLLLYDQFGMSLKFAPDGKTLAVGTYSGLHLVDTTTRKDVHTYASRLCVGKTATFTPDGKLLLLGHFDGAIRIIEAATGNILRDVPAHEEAVTTLALSPDGKTLASGSADTTVLLWDMAEILRPADIAKKVIGAEQLEAWWKDLAAPSGTKAFEAINQLAAAPLQAAPFLKGKLRPMGHVDPKVLGKLFTDLNSTKPEERERALGELEELGELARGELQKRLAAKPSRDIRQRLEKLLAKLDGPVTSPELLQMFGAIEALGKMGTPEALAILEAMAQGAPGHRVTEDARAAVKRLKRS